MTSPKTSTGRIVFVFYCLAGCPMVILFFDLLLERIVTLLSRAMTSLHSCRLSHVVTSLREAGRTTTAVKRSRTNKVT